MVTGLIAITILMAMVMTLQGAFLNFLIDDFFFIHTHLNNQLFTMTKL